VEKRFRNGRGRRHEQGNAPFSPLIGGWAPAAVGITTAGDSVSFGRGVDDDYARFM